MIKHKSMRVSAPGMMICMHHHGSRILELTSFACSFGVVTRDSLSGLKIQSSSHALGTNEWFGLSLLPLIVSLAGSRRRLPMTFNFILLPPERFPGQDNWSLVMGLFIHPRKLDFHDSNINWRWEFYVMANGLDIRVTRFRTLYSTFRWIVKMSAGVYLDNTYVVDRIIRGCLASVTP